MSLYPAASSRLLSSTSATTTERPSVESATRSPAARRMITVESGLGMSGNVRPLAKASHQGTSFSAPGFVPTSPVQHAALRFLKSQPTPLKPKWLVRHTGWSLARVRRWLQFFAAKGLLVPTPAGHVWAEGARP